MLLNINHSLTRTGQLIFTLIFSVGIISCGSTPSSKTTTPSVINQSNAYSQQNTDSQSMESPELLIEEAETEWLQSGDITKRNQLLLKLADHYQASNQCDKSLTVISKIKDSLNATEQHIHADLLIAECAKPDAFSLETRTKLVNLPAGSDNLRFRQHRVLAAIYERQHQWLLAANELARSTQINNEISAKIWELINQSSYAEQQQAFNRYPALSAWLALSAILHRFGENPRSLETAFQDFSENYSQHPLVINPPQELIDGIDTAFTPPDRIAAILPLSGRFEAQGTAIKNGLLTAYYQQIKSNDSLTTPEITFFDSSAESMESIAAQIKDVDLIIGPLLKSNIDALLPILPDNIGVVGLNRIDMPSQSANPLPTLGLDGDSNEQQMNEQQLSLPHYFFALAPEDEARQMAEMIVENGYSTPILIHAQDSISQRLSAAFLDKWRKLNSSSDNDDISVVSFNDNDEMREGITSALDVAQSKARINQLENILIPELYNVPRNRRDVDVIIAFTTPDQTELLNPIIESSLSPFNDKSVPVYVTSRSISWNVSKNQLRDLQNIRFIDVPWLMPQQHNQLRSQIESIFPNQFDALKRLFALGYDAFDKLSTFAHLDAIPQLTTEGLTGTLRINDNNEIVRTLPKAMINDQSIIAVR